MQQYIPYALGASLGLVALSFPVRSYFQGGKVNPKNFQKNLKNQVFVITGANIGIGFESAKQLYSQNGTVFLLCRTKSKALQAMDDLRKSVPNSEGELEFVPLDLSDLESVKQASQDVISKLNGRKITTLINNAGVMNAPHNTTKQGFELQFGTNVLGHFALTGRLLPHIDPKNGRIVNLSSLAHEGGTHRIQFENLKGPAKSQSIYHLYNQSKLGNVLFTKALARRLEQKGSSIRTVALHPGVVRTNLFQYHTILFSFATLPFQYLFMKTAQNGAQTSLHCTLSDDIKQGAYYSDCKERPVVDTANEVDFQEKMWSLAKEWTNVDIDAALESI